MTNYLKTTINPVISYVVIGISIAVFLIIAYFAHKAYIELDVISHQDIVRQQSL